MKRLFVLDSPMLDLRGTVEHGAEQLELPINYLDDTSWVSVPTLVFHGAEDIRVPVASAERLGHAAPELVTLVKVEGAGHVEDWNADPRSYDRKLAAFLGQP